MRVRDDPELPWPARSAREQLSVEDLTPSAPATATIASFDDLPAATAPADAEQAEPSARALADLDALAPARDVLARDREVSARERETPGTEREGRPEEHEAPARAREATAEQPAGIALADLDVLATGPDREGRAGEGGAPAGEGGAPAGEGEATAEQPAGIALADLDALVPAPDHEAPAELGALPAPVEESTRLTMDDLRFGRRGQPSRDEGSGARTERGPKRATRAEGSGEATERGGNGATRPPADRERPTRGGTARTLSDDAPALDTESAAWEAGESTPVGADPDRPTRSSRGRGRQGRGRRFGADRRAEPAEDTRTPEEQEAAAKEVCLRLLTDRARTAHELRQKLGQQGYSEEIATRVLARFDEVGLIDDEAFAAAWVRSRHRTRGLGRRAIAQELRRKGVEKEIADEALGELDDDAEAQRARELVDRKLRTMTVTGPDDRRKAANRLVGMLARKGYPAGVAYGVVRAALADHGADEDELGPPDL